ncbi:PREDICTED: uncharacterized protein LOC108759131 isoform X2 [Trachymyrmex cornetzi]|nr:PREDICTED: uncharacterized protein LOC108759131 isoform X2 [Trachymyrmex cornetzi]
MPRMYTRKTNRATWSQDSLTEAIDQISQNKMNIWNASKYYDIPYRTLKRRINENNFNKGALGRPAFLGDHESKLITYIQKMENTGFPLTANAIRKLAFTFALKNNLLNKFSQNTEIVGYDWFCSFMKRHPKLSIKKAEGISVARGLGMCREEVDNYFQLLLKICEENNLFDQPFKVYNVDEIGLQLNNNVSKVVTTKGSQTVHHVTSAEEGETINVIACCNAEGNFLPPYCIFKGQRKRPEFEDGLPPGSHVEMGETSAYVNCQLFLAWLKDHFIPRKQNGKVLLILDGHTSHCSDINVLDFAAKNDIILLCLPSHTTHYLQPLDRSFFKPLKTYWQRVVTNWIISHPGQRLTRYQFGDLLCNAWNLATTVSNGTSGFKACGIFPYNPAQIPEHAFRISNTSEELKDTSTEPKSKVLNTLSNNEESTDISQVTLFLVQSVYDHNENVDEPSTSVSCPLTRSQEYRKSLRK